MNILFLCTYPIKDPKHGGQLRARSIVEKYRQSGHNVQVAGVIGSDHYSQEYGFSKYPGVSILSKYINNPSLMEDYAIGMAFSQSDDLFRDLFAKITLVPDLIHVEQPWLFSFAKRYVSHACIEAKIVYGSQNVEWRLKREILSTHMGVEEGIRCSNLVKKTEIEAIAGSDLILCVSQSDYDWLSTQTNAPVLLAPNGVQSWKSTENGKIEAEQITKGKEYALYCASAHPPNVTGFFELFSSGFGSLKPDEQLVVAGSVGWSIAADSRVHQSAKLAEKIVLAGEVSKVCLDGLLDGSKCIVLPITQGGGTNLKTAEALWSGKYVVATSVAMRGFEEFRNAQGVFVADDEKSFKRALRNAMSSPPLQLGQMEIDARRCVLWEETLSILDQMLQFLAPKMEVRNE